ncbi:MAG: trypsin-like serine protease [Ruminococcaceae bacterium]|nr:trypsin-like serine protease [Oscillospiraceae bacterium]
MNNENERYSFNVTPADAEASAQQQYYQQPYAPQTDPGEAMRNEMKSMKKSMTRMVAICCAVCLIIGIGGGALVGSMLGRSNNQPGPDYTNTTLAGNLPSTGDENVSTTTTENKDDLEIVTGRLYAVSNGEGESMSTEKVVEAVENSVVSIRVETQVSTGYYHQSTTATGAGSGVIISADGYIVTNNHVIEGADKIIITTTENEEYEAVLVGSDDLTDIALLKVEAKDLPFAVIGNSDNLKRGQTAIVIGNPLGTLSGTVTVGVVSGLDRNITMSDGDTMNLLQIDAAINPGNSGGGMFNDKGELVGIIVAKNTATEIEGLGFAIPVTDILSILDELMENGYVSGRPAIGITTIEVNNAMDAMMYRVNYLGVYVGSVANPETNPLQAGDYIISIDGTEITSNTQVADALTDKQAGDVLTMEILRSNEKLTIEVTLVEEGTLKR